MTGSHPPTVGVTWHAGAMDVPGTFGRAMLALGSEALLAERAMDAFVAKARRARPDAEVSSLDAADLDTGVLATITGGSLFASASIVVISGLDNLPSEVTDAVVALATNPGDDLALALTHPGGAKGRGVVDKLKKAGVGVVACAPIKPWEVPKFAAAEARHRGARMDEATAAALVDAVGSDLRAVAAAVAQLANDVESHAISLSDVRRYFGGRAEVTSYGVADDIMAGRLNDALAKLRWALATGVAPVMVTGAIATSLRSLGRYVESRDMRLGDADLARLVGVPPWKLKSLAGQAREWPSAAIARAIQLAAVADAQVKGAAVDPAFALEQLVMKVGALRRPLSHR